MTFEEYDFILQDRIAKIKAINEQFNLLDNAYISFSGGKDSTILHYLIDLALPNNKIPRLFMNTGIEYTLLVKFVKNLAKNDDRIIILNSGVNLRNMWETEGYPFKSKEHSLRVYYFNKTPQDKLPAYIKKYITGIDKNGKQTKFRCPNILKYQFETQGKYNYSNKCCYRLKKEPAHKWALENKKSIVLTGMRNEEGGNRANIGCTIINKGKLQKFHPLIVVSEEWEEAFIKYQGIKLCELYYEPYNFTRTGCKGCPFALDLQHNLDILEQLLPNEYKQCEHLFGKVYDEYRRIGYRLKKEANDD